jgi:hypothetical protein
MNMLFFLFSIFVVVALSMGEATAQQNVRLGDNAALRYWSAFARMQDSAITDQQAKELAAILDGTAAYDDSQDKDLVEKNRAALETMIRATALPNCDWGLDYRLGADLPVDYVRTSLSLGRLNVLCAFHLLLTGDKEVATHALASGILFSQDVANGGSFFATLVAKNLLVAHLKAAGLLSARQRSLPHSARRYEPQLDASDQTALIGSLLQDLTWRLYAPATRWIRKRLPPSHGSSPFT